MKKYSNQINSINESVLIDLKNSSTAQYSDYYNSVANVLENAVTCLTRLEHMYKDKLEASQEQTK